MRQPAIPRRVVVVAAAFSVLSLAAPASATDDRSVFGFALGAAGPTEKTRFSDLPEPMRFGTGFSIEADASVPIASFRDDPRLGFIRQINVRAAGHCVFMPYGGNGSLGSNLRGDFCGLNVGLSTPFQVDPNGFAFTPFVAVGVQSFTRKAQSAAGVDFSSSFLGAGPVLGMEFVVPVGAPPQEGGPPHSFVFVLSGGAFFGDMKENSAGARADASATVLRGDVDVFFNYQLTPNISIRPGVGLTHFANAGDDTIGPGVFSSQDSTFWRFRLGARFRF